LRGDITDLITRANFFVNQFRGFGVLIPPMFPFSISLADCPYNSVSITVLLYISPSPPTESTEATMTVQKIRGKTRMWADAQRDGHPAEYRWRPLLNTAKFG